jgi:N-acetylglutamate synthase-like GNAT family acetyltransferase
MVVRQAALQDADWIGDKLREYWGDTRIVSRGVSVDAMAASAAIAEEGERRCGLATYQITAAECEILTLNAFEPRRGVGTALIEFVMRAARGAACASLVVVTTNDNLDALRFYQRRGFVVFQVTPRAVEAARILKPSIPQIGAYGIPIRDEIVFRLEL